ncbi:hypothetical protein M406DRAFT_334843 [Cryphonectria parasitica EP155]|uniref:Spo12-like protein n=1 Tax=Cryphonectria parasitica (strain ATCC 38755 / EP155) TaxID=660469 RepID=A0A9P4XST6_CRYP1|nr:uncharacterized protein M406DRAFT_334843 [Cryphonectria parasitica EP155]KAF3760167.1 hypothetical protein M406DRAFT_334843 [Cryphonectria parasitica EP155]
MSSFSNNANVLGVKDVNVPMTASAVPAAGDVKKDLEYHRQVLKSKMEAQEYDTTLYQPAGSFSSDAMVSSRLGNNYISPSDEIMSPCTAKLNALRNKQVGKVKPKSLFAQASSKRLQGQEGLFGAKATPPASISQAQE